MPHNVSVARCHALHLFVAAFVIEASIASAPVFAETIDFESLPLGASDRMTIDPYTVPGSAVVFTALSCVGFLGEVGLVKNSATSACVVPADEGQKLGTAPVGSGQIGLSCMPIKATFPVPIPPPATVSVQVQSGAGLEFQLRLFNSANEEFATTVQLSGPPDGVCPGQGGTPRARFLMSAIAVDELAYCIIDGPDGVVFVIDDFTFEAGPIAVAPISWGSIKNGFR